MLKAIILDFNGVILNDEPIHFAAMREAVADLGIDLTREAYWNKYLPFDDAQCLEAICRDHSFRLSAEQRNDTLARKSGNYRRLLKGEFPLFPGAAQFVSDAAHRYPLALASGARREEIETTLDATDLACHFTAIVAAEDFLQGKPHPESFLLALRRLNEILGAPPILPAECMVVEDSVGGIQGARAAGMICLAVANSYTCEALQTANRVITSLEEVKLESLRTLFEETA